MDARSPFDALARPELLRAALETMHVGHLLDRALMPQVFLLARDVNVVDDVAIDEWMGASPVYTARTRRLMGIDGDSVPAIVKALQLDCGFPHQYMDVGWRVVDDTRGEFWLRHCGALLDVEPHGEARVVGMCHKIEDPTFDATAYATNPRARIRPIHRPPRVPSDRHPHCHWTIAIDPASEPVGPAKNTRAVAALPLASAPNPRAPERDPGWSDYRGAVDPEFTLARLSSATLAAVAREFQFQEHLLASSAELALTERFGAERAREALAAQWTAVGYVGARRLAAALGTGEGAGAVARILALSAALPPAFAREISVEDRRVRAVLRPARPALLDRGAPGWLGLLARGDGRGLEAAAQGVDARARLLDLALREDAIEAQLEVDPAAAPAPEPAPAKLLRFSTATGFAFDYAR
jgi:hypothetical protein